MSQLITFNPKSWGIRFAVFFLICCSTFSFIPVVRLRLALEYLTISLSSESLSFILILSLSSRSILKPEYITHDPSLVPSFKWESLLYIDTLPLERKSTLLMTLHLSRSHHSYLYACLKPPLERLSIQGQTVLAPLTYTVVQVRVSPLHWYSPPRAEEYITHDPSLVPFTPFTLICLPETSVRKTFDTGSNCTCPSRKPTALIPLVG